MTRTVPEWIGRSDDEPFPPRVRLRILARHGGNCAGCGLPIVGAFTCDHIIAIINGGENRESNGQPLCNKTCNPKKNASDVAIKSATAISQKKRHGLKPKWHRPMDGSRDSPWKKPMNSPAVRRRM